MGRTLEFRSTTKEYPDLFTPAVVAALEALAPLNADRRAVMAARIARRHDRLANHRRIEFLPADGLIARTVIKVQDARDGNFDGGEIPADLRRQWIQGTGPATKPRASVESGIRNVAYALLSGADGWMFDGEDALGQVDTMSLDNQRNLKLAIARDPLFLEVAEEVAREMNAWAQGFFGRPIIADWRTQLDFTTGDLPCAAACTWMTGTCAAAGGTGFSASIADLALFVVNNHQRLRAAGRSIVLYLPKTQTAEDAALWNDMHPRARGPPGPAGGHDQVLRAGGAARAVLPAHGDPRRPVAPLRGLQHRPLGLHQQRLGRAGLGSGLREPQHRRDHHDLRLHADLRGPRAPGHEHAGPQRPLRALAGRHGDPTSPWASGAGVAASMKRAVAGAEREQREGATGKWVAHWKMVHIVRPVWERAGQDNQLGRAFPPLTYTAEDAAGLTRSKPAPRTVRGARDLL